MWKMLVLVACFLVSAAAVYFSAKNCYQPTDATRGGAIASILALAILIYDTRKPEKRFSQFVSLAIQTEQQLSEAAKRPLAERVADATRHIDMLRGGVVEYITSNKQEAAWQTAALWVATLISVAFWGFGDLMMTGLRQFFSWSCPVICQACGQ
jgi:hypothetical protein